MNALASVASEAEDSPVLPRLRLLSTGSSASSSSSAASSFYDSSFASDMSTNDASSDYKEESTSEGLLRLAKAASTISSMEFSLAASPMKTTHVVSDYYDSSPEASTPPPYYSLMAAASAGQSRTPSDMHLHVGHGVGLGTIGGPYLHHHANERPRMMTSTAGCSGASAVSIPSYPPRYSYASVGGGSDVGVRGVVGGTYPQPPHAPPLYPGLPSAPDLEPSIPAMSIGTPADAIVGGKRKSAKKKKRKYTKSGLFSKKTKFVTSASALVTATGVTVTVQHLKGKDKTKKATKKAGGQSSSGKKTKAAKKLMVTKKKKTASSLPSATKKSTKNKVVQLPENTSLTQTLLQMLNDPDIDHIVSWQPNGKAFDIHDKKAFVDQVFPLYFPHSRSSVANAMYTSFTRKLNRYGFKLMNRGRLAGGYYHALFQRDRPALAEGIVCESKPKTSRGK